MRTLIVMAMACGICGAAADAPETVLTTYRVKPGKEAEFLRAQADAWQVIRRANLASASPHLLLRTVDTDGKPCFIELLSWRDHEAPDHAPADLRALWNQLETLCEPRDGHRGIEFPEVTIVNELP